MDSTLIVARMEDESAESVAKLFGEFDETEMPRRMGTRRRQLFYYRGLYFHLQDFDDGVTHGGEAIEKARTHPLFVGISAALRAYIDPYDPNWKRPSDAMATRFYKWEQS
ncbi:MAG: TcmI family type II polyketide cyclase [Sciscionella sp.]